LDVVLHAVDPVGVVVTATLKAVGSEMPIVGIIGIEKEPGAETFIGQGVSTKEEPTVGDAEL
jgi:hypothetical protein